MSLPTTLHLTNAYHQTSGGIRTFYHALLTAASALGRSMHLVVPAATDRMERVDRWTTIHHVGAARSPVFDRRYRLLRPDHYWSRGSRVGRILASVRPDVVEVCDKYTLSQVGRLARAGWYWNGHRPTVVGLSCERMDDNVAAYLPGGRYVVRAAHAYLRRLYAPAFDVHVANSRYTADELTARAGLESVFVQGMGVDADMFAAARPDPARRRALLAAAGGGTESVLVLYAGRVSPEKHMDPLVQAIGELGRRSDVPDVRLVVVGDGPYLRPLERLASDVAPGRLFCAGNVADRTELASVYASADVFAHTNPREPFGIAPLEAMAAGVPVVLPGEGGVLSYAHQGNAWLVAPTPDGFAAGILDAVRTRDVAKLAAARHTAHEHAWPVVAGRYFDLLDGLHSRRVQAARPAVTSVAAEPSGV